MEELKSVEEDHFLPDDCLRQNENIGVVSFVMDDPKEFRVFYVNEGFFHLIGYHLKDISDFFDGNYLNLIPEVDQGVWKEKCEESGNGSYRKTYRLMGKNRDILWIDDKGYIFMDQWGRKCVTAIFTDVTEVKNRENEIALSAERLRYGLKASKTCVFEVDLIHQRYICFENAEEIFGVSGDKILEDIRYFSTLDRENYQKEAARYFSHPGDVEMISFAFQSILNGIPTVYEARMRAGNSEFIWCKLEVTPIMSDGVPVRMIGVITNINTNKITAEKLKAQATQDSFTNLYNKKYTEFRIQDEIERNHERKHALIILDLDDFKQINDAHGHFAGDQVIKSTSESLRKIFRKGDVIGRFGGDEFVVFMKDIPNIEAVSAKLDQILHTENGFDVTKSIGVAIFPEDGRDYKTLLQNADYALYESKDKKNQYTIYAKTEK